MKKLIFNSSLSVLTLFLVSFCFLITSCEKEDFSIKEENRVKSMVSVVPSGYSLVKSKKGCRLYRKSISGGGAYYVQEINLDTATLQLLREVTEGDFASSNTPSPLFRKASVASFWSSYNLVGRKFSMVNASFFGPGALQSINCSTQAELTYPAKQGAAIFSCGYNNGVSSRRFVYSSSTKTANVLTVPAITQPTYANMVSSIGSNTLVLGGMTFPTNTTTDSRTAIGVSSTGKKVYIFSSQTPASYSSVSSALTSFGASSSKLILLDGGGSTQLVCDGTNYTPSQSRCVPLVLTAFHGN